MWNNRNRLGGTSLAQVYNQLGNESPDVDNKIIKKAFNAVQKLISDNLIIAGHDRSDGGLIRTLLEMAFAGNCGIEVEMQDAGCMMQDRIMSKLFSEELGLVIEYLPKNGKEDFSGT